MKFVHVQKTAGNSIRSALGLPVNPPDKHRTARELRAAVGTAAWESAYTFCFVRNPWERLVSWWSMIDGNRPADGATGGSTFFRYIWERARTFEEFILECTDTIHDLDGAKSILRPQLDYLADENGAVIVDFVGRYENLHGDFAVVAERLGRPGLALPMTNRSSHAPYPSYYTSELAELVAQRFRPDLETFGYCFGD